MSQHNVINKNHITNYFEDALIWSGKYEYGESVCWTYFEIADRHVQIIPSAIWQIIYSKLL